MNLDNLQLVGEGQSSKSVAGGCMRANYKGLFERWELAITRKLIREFRARWQSLKQDEFEEVMQECLVHWLSVRRELDPARAPVRSAFMATVVRNKLTDLVRERESGKRKATYDSISLDAPLGDEEDSLTFLDFVVEAQPREGDDHLRALAEEARADIFKAMKHLTPLQQQLCHLLGCEGLSVQDASRKLGIPRATIYDELKRIRKSFTELGLQYYLKT